MVNLRMIRRTATMVLIGAVRVYQAAKPFFLPQTCRFYPTCSEYAAEAVKKYGPVQGSWRAVRRICRCHPFHPGGYDPA